MMSPSLVYLGVLLSILSQFVSASVKISTTVTVSTDGNGNFTSINDAIAAAPNNSDGTEGYFCIKIMEGTYHEYVVVEAKKSFLMMIGAGINRTIITGNRNHIDGWDTMTSATFSAYGRNFIVMNLTIRNTAGPTKEQAVALLSSGDSSVFYKCSIEGYQDTLYAYYERQFFRECDVYGTVDFIFGTALVVLQKCNIYARQPIKGQSNEITAQGREEPTGRSAIVIQNCTIAPTIGLIKSKYKVKTYLGRPWKKYSTTIVMESFIDGFVEPTGWDEFSGDSGLKTLYYAEYNNFGPGSNTSNRITWPGYHVVNSSVASQFTVSRFLQGDTWIPQTKVPYIGGLVN